MGKFTDEELSRMAGGRSPEELAYLNMDDGEFERHGAELRAAHAQGVHELEMLKAAGLHEVNNLRFDPAVIEYANHIRASSPRGDKPGLDDIVEGIVAPYREKYLASFDTEAPAAVHKIGLNESAFLKLLGGK
ncbi:MAG: hypothetical protein V3U93_03470 [Alphaproteobacteria bacterium]